MHAGKRARAGGTSNGFCPFTAMLCPYSRPPDVVFDPFGHVSFPVPSPPRLASEKHVH